MVANPTIPDSGVAAEGTAEQLRVAVISDATPERNGVGSYYSDLVAQLDGRIGHAALYCPEDDGQHWHRYVAPPLPGDSTQRIWFPRPFKLWRQVKALRPHAIIVPTPGPYGLFGLFLARRMKVPLIIGFHTHYEALAGIYWSDLWGKICRWYLESCNRLLFRHASLTLANSPEMVRLAENMGAARVELMGTSVARDMLERPLKPLEPVVKRVLFAGRLAEEKNVPLVIDVARQRPGLEVSIAGDGPMRAEIEAAAVELPNLSYLGWVPRERIAATIDAHDIMLLPSKVESFGTVALEGMARGRPVVVSDDCGIAEWPDLAKGLFCIGADETVLTAVDRIVAMPAEGRKQVAANARRAACELNEWNIDTWIQRLQPDLNPLPGTEAG